MNPSPQPPRAGSVASCRLVASLLLVLALVPPRLSAATLQWVGPGTGQHAWSAPSNWQGGRVPGPTDDVIIQGEGLTLVVQVTGTATARSIDSTATIRIVGEITANGQLSVGGTFLNRGVVRLDSTRSDRESGLSVTGADGLDNRGLLHVAASDGGQRRLIGAVANRGRIQVEQGIALAVDNRDRTFAALDGRIEAPGQLAINGGRVILAGGDLSGDVRAFNAAVAIDASFVATATLRVLGPGCTLLRQASPSATLRLDTDIANNTILAASTGAVNAGRIVLGSSRGDRNTRLVAGGGLENRPTGVIEAVGDAGGGRAFDGVLHNQGALLAPDQPFVFTGTYDAAGGRVAGQVRFQDVRLLVSAPSPVVHELQLYGSGSTVLSPIDTNLVVRVISDLGASARLSFNTNLLASDGRPLFNTNLVVHGTIQLESLRSDRTTTLDVGAHGLVNHGSIVAATTSGGGRRLQGGVFNRGRLAVEAGSQLVVANAESTFVQQAGRIDSAGTLAVEGGLVEVRGGRLTGSIRLYETATFVAPTLEVATALVLVGPTSRLVSNASPLSTLILQTEVVQNTTLVPLPGAINAGRLILDSARSDRFSRLRLSSPFTNAPDGEIVAVVGSGGERGIDGHLVNQGRLAADGIVLGLTGTYQSDGGSVAGTVRFQDARILPTRIPSEPVELSLFGSGSVLAGDLLPNHVLRVIADIGANARLSFNTNLVNLGVIRLESQRADRLSSLRAADGTLQNGPEGLIVTVPSAGGTRSVEGALRNRGQVRLEHPLAIGAPGGAHLNEGRIDLGGFALGVAGASFLNAPGARLLGSGELDVRPVAFTNAGILAPGGSPGRLTVRGNFTQATSGLVDVEIAGAQGPGTGHDVIEVLAGRINLLGGTLSTRVAGAFVPAPDARFRVLTAEQGITGRFERTPNLQVQANRYLQTEYLPNALDLRALSGVNTALPPSIVVHPLDQEAEEQGQVQFLVAANGTGPFTYQWRRNGQPIPGANGNVLQLPRIAATDFGTYDVVVSNAAGSSTSDAARLNQKVTPGGVPYDYGDAPDTTFPTTYPTTAAHNGAAQRVQPGFSLGPTIDADNGTQQNATATADGADEDGVQFLDPLVLGQTVRIRVLFAGGPQFGAGRLSAWMDWDADGSWAQAGDLILNNVVLVQRTNDFLVTVPNNAKVGDTFSRFRLYSDTPQGFAGKSQEDGEVEDYKVGIGTGTDGGPGGQGTHDFGDAPDSYLTTLARNGPRHAFLAGLHLGAALDTEPDGATNVLAIGDDIAGQPDDEDGVTGSSILVRGSVQSLAITVVGSGRVDAWIDFDRNGTFTNATDRIVGGLVMNSETRTITFGVPLSAVPGPAYARFRLSRQGVADPFGPAPDGEVEDYAVLIVDPPRDWGDAPEGYPTIDADNGAHHTRLADFHLGKSIDAEPDGQPNANATGDDVTPKDGSDDEDGVTFTTPLFPGETAEVRVEASRSGVLDAWIDFAADESWNQPGDRIFAGVPLASGINVLSFPVPANARLGRTFARFRFSAAGVNAPTGDGGEGEVEDYRVVVERDSGCELGCNGRDFWLAFPGNYAPDPASPVTVRLRVSGPAGTAVEVRIPGLATTLATNLGAGGGVTLTLPSTVDLGDASDTVLPRGVHVTAAAPVTVQAISQVKHTSDGFLALPTDVVTGEYVVAAYPNTHVGVPEVSGSQFAVVATQPATRVTITPSQETGLRLAGVPYSVTLTNAGDCYVLRNTDDAPADLSGTVIEADQPVGVFAGHACANVDSPSLFFCDYVVEQILPTERLGSEFFTAPLATRSGGETVRIVATHNDTTVDINGDTVVLARRGDVHQVLLAQPAHIVADKPVQVAQFASSSDFDGVTRADPFMVNVPARPHFTTTHAFATGGTNFVSHHVTVVVPAAVVSLTLDGTVQTPAFTTIGPSAHKYAHLTVSAGFHTLTAAAPFGAIVYGWNEYESYGWPACLFFGDTTPPRLTVSTNRVVRNAGTAGDLQCKASVPDLRQNVVVRDNCGISGDAVVTQRPQPGTLVGVGTHDIVLSVVDNRGNVGRTTVEFVVVDAGGGTQITFQCPADRTVRCDDETGAVVKYDVVALRGCTPIAVECSPPSGSRFPLGTTLVTCRIVEPGVPVQQCTFPVTVTCSSQRQVRIQPVSRPVPTPAEPNPPAEIAVEWDAENDIVLEVSESIQGPWAEVPTTGTRHVIRILQERGKFFRLRGRR